VIAGRIDPYTHMESKTRAWKVYFSIFNKLKTTQELI